MKLSAASPAISLTAVAFAALVMGLSACATANASSVPAPSMPTASDAASQTAGAGDDLAAYPAASANETRHVIRLPVRPNEDDLKVELIIGRTHMIDCNHHSLGGSIEPRTAQGWGYEYFVVTGRLEGVSTLMGCPDNTRREAFVRGGGEPTLVRYNSRLPVVVYAPRDVEVRYRIWSAGPEERAPR